MSENLANLFALDPEVTAQEKYIEEGACTCGENARWELEIDEGRAVLTCQVCGKGLASYFTDCPEMIYMTGAVPVALHFERNCTGHHEESCDCDTFLRIELRKGSG